MLSTWVHDTGCITSPGNAYGIQATAPDCVGLRVLWFVRRLLLIRQSSQASFLHSAGAETYYSVLHVDRGVTWEDAVKQRDEYIARMLKENLPPSGLSGFYVDHQKHGALGTPCILRHLVETLSLRSSSNTPHRPFADLQTFREVCKCEYGHLCSWLRASASPRFAACFALGSERPICIPEFPQAITCLLDRADASSVADACYKS